jgi:hypothetical protein
MHDRYENEHFCLELCWIEAKHSHETRQDRERGGLFNKDRREGRESACKGRESAYKDHESAARDCDIA